jgi:hypothetical protein
MYKPRRKAQGKAALPACQRQVPGVRAWTALSWGRLGPLPFAGSPHSRRHTEGGGYGTQTTCWSREYFPSQSLIDLGAHILPSPRCKYTQTTQNFMHEVTHRDTPTQTHVNSCAQATCLPTQRHTLTQTTAFTTSPRHSNVC